MITICQKHVKGLCRICIMDESKHNDQQPYIIHPGSALAAPWYNPRGFWGRGGRKDYTDHSMVY
jgi:hypothetical protein